MVEQLPVEIVGAGPSRIIRDLSLLLSYWYLFVKHYWDCVD